MDLKIKIQPLSETLGRLGITTHNSTIPILSSIKLEAQKAGWLVLATTNLDQYIIERVPAQVKKEGATIVSYRLLQNFVGRAASLEMTMKLQEATEGKLELLVCRHGESVAFLETLPVDEFPPPYEIKDGTKLELENLEELVKPLTMVKHAMSTEETSYNLQGVSIISSDKNGCEVCATDRRRMAHYRSGLKFDKPVRLIVPSQAVEVITRIFQKGTGRITTNDSIMKVQSPTIDFRTKLVEGNFPNYKEVVSINPKEAFSAKRKELSDALTTASLFLRRTEIAVWLKGEKKEMVVGCYDRFSARLMGTELEEQPKLKKHINFRYILDALAVLSEEDVRIQASADTAIVLREGSFTEVVNALAIDSNDQVINPGTVVPPQQSAPPKEAEMVGAST